MKKQQPLKEAVIEDVRGLGPKFEAILQGSATWDVWN